MNYYYSINSKGLFGTVIYYDNFENGTAPWNVDGELNAGGGTNALTTIQTDGNAISGTKVLRMRADDTTTGTIAQTNNFRYNSFDNTDDILVSFKFLMPQVIDHEDNFNSFTNFWQVKATNNTDRNDPLWVLGIKNRGGKGIGGANYLSLSYLGQFWPELGVAQHTVEEIGVTNIDVGVWHNVQIRYERHNGNGQIQVYQNGKMTHIATGVNTYPSTQVPFVHQSINNYGEGRISKDGDGILTGLGYSDILVENYGVYEYGGKALPIFVDDGIPNEFWPNGDVTGTGEFGEAEDASMWSDNSVDITINSTDPQHGSFSLKVTANAVTHYNTRAYVNINSPDTENTYILDFYARASNPAAQVYVPASSLDGASNAIANITSSTWTRYQLELDFSGFNFQLRVNPFIASGEGTIGDVIELDNVRLYAKP